MNTWDPALYLKFEEERTQPSRDLIARIALHRPMRIIDLGCGPGNSTRELRKRWPDASITGLDSSAVMLARARKDFPEGNWVQADLSEWESGEPFNLVFSNATIQWVADHGRLIPRLFGCVEPGGGALAVQVPANSGSPLHQAALAVSGQGQWRDAMAGCAGLMTYHEPGFYYGLLSTLAKRIFLWETTYYHVMANQQALIDWYSGTGLKPFLDRLRSEELRTRFQNEVLAECRQGYPEQRDGNILFAFKRLFFVAYRD